MLFSKHFKSTCFIENKLFKTAVPGDHCHKDTTISNLPDQSAIVELASPSRMPLIELSANIITSTNSGIGQSAIQEGDQKRKMLIRKLKNRMNRITNCKKLSNI